MLVLLLVVVAGIVAVLTVPRVARDLAVRQLAALTGRPVNIDALHLSLRTGEFSVRGFRLTDHDGGRLADFERLEGRFRPAALLRGHLALERVTLNGAHLRIVRVGPNRLNISDLLARGGGSGQGLAVSVTQLDVTDASIAVEDRVLTPTRTWRADDIRLLARDVTPQGRTGTAVASTTVAGALLSMRADQVNLTPLHLRAWINVRDFDLRLAALYLPADAVVLQRGTLDAGIAVTVDAGDGTRLDADAVVDGLALRRPGLDGDALTAPALQVLVRDLHHRPGATSLRYASLGGDLTVLDPTTTPPRRLTFSDFTATASGLEQPLRGQTRVAVHANVPGGGEVDASGSVGLTPRAADVRVRARGIELAALGPYLPIAGRLEGVVRADVRVTATHEQSFSLTVAGDATLERAGLGDGTRTLASATRVAATAIEYTWPATVRVGQLTVAQPVVTLERDRDGTIGLVALVTPGAPTASGSDRASAAPAAGGRPAAGFAVARLRVEDGRALLTDAASGARVDARRIALTAEELGWPGGGAARVQASAAIGDTQVSAQGTVDAARRSADVALRVHGADLATLQPWLPITGRVRGGADADVRIVAAQEGALRVAVSGDLTLHRVALLDGTRPVAEAARIAATGLEYTWPASVRATSLTLSQPSAIVERAADGSIGLTALVRRSSPAPADADQTTTGEPAATPPPPSLDLTVAQLRVEDGRATLIDAATGGRADLTRLGITARDVAWPAGGDAPVQISGAVAGGTVTARGKVDAGARRGELAVTLRGADLGALQPWLAMTGRVRGAADADVTLTAALEPLTLTARGRVGVTSLAFLDSGQPLLTVGRVEAADLELDWPTRLSIDRLRVNAPWAKIERDARGQLSLRTLFERPPGRPAPPPAEPAAVPGPLPGLQVTVRDALFEDGGTSIVDDSVEPAVRLDVKGTRLALRDLTWPARGVAAVDLSTPMPGREGTLRARGTFSIEPTRLALDVDLDKVDLAPARPYLPIDARLSGRLSGRAKVMGTFGDTITVAIDGDATADRLALGDENRRLATVRQADLKGLRYRYPASLRVKQVTLDKPWLLVERDSAGRLELVALVTAKREPPPPRPGGAPAPAEQEPRVRLLIETLTLQDGFVRFVDRTTEPDYAEEISGIAVTATGLGTRPARHGKIVLQGTFASGTPLTVNGEVGGFTGPRYFDAVVDVRDFPMPRLNPHLMSLLGWRATSGTLTAAVRYRVIGDDLEATNDITLTGLEVERPAGVAADAGPPLDTLVSLLKDREGVIKLNVPVHGRLSEPEFDYGEAVWAAVRNLAIRLVALPFSLVGKLFFTPDSRIRAVTVDPVTFQSGRAAPTADGLEQLQQLARFLAQAPAVRLRLRPVTTVADVAVLRREALDARLASLGADADARRRAAVGLYAELFPRRQPPSSDEALFEELTRETPTPPRALRDLAAGRVAAVGDALARAGIAADRLERLESRAAVESEGAARVEFEISR